MIQCIHSLRQVAPTLNKQRVNQKVVSAPCLYGTIGKHKGVLCQALLEEWRSELARKPLAMTEKEACAVLGVPLEEGQGQTRGGPPSEDALKAAYR